MWENYGIVSKLTANLARICGFQQTSEEPAPGSVEHQRLEKKLVARHAQSQHPESSGGCNPKIAWTGHSEAVIDGYGERAESCMFSLSHLFAYSGSTKRLWKIHHHNSKKRRESSKKTSGSGPKVCWKRPPKHFDGAEVAKDINEVVLLHGTKPPSAGASMLMAMSLQRFGNKYIIRKIFGVFLIQFQFFGRRPVPFGGSQHLHWKGRCNFTLYMGQCSFLLTVLAFRCPLSVYSQIDNGCGIKIVAVFVSAKNTLSRHQPTNACTKCKQPKQSVRADRSQEIQQPQTNANKTFSSQRL